MKYSEFKVNDTGCTYVFGDEAEREKFIEAFLQNNPEFKTEILPCLINYKKPFLGSPKSACDVMVKDLKRRKREEIIRELHGASRHVDLDNLLYRSPRALSGGQRLRWSIVYETIMGKRSFIIREDTPLMNEDMADKMEEWIYNYTAGEAKVLYIAESAECFPYDTVCYELCDGGIKEFVIPLPKPEPVVVPEVVVAPAEVEKTQDETVAKILQMRDKYNGLFSKKQ